MNDSYDWQGRVGENWAREHARTDRSFAGLTRQLVERIRALAPGCVLDIGCGAGETSILVGRHNRETDVVGIDLSAQLIASAKRRGRALKNVRFEIADAATWRDPAFVPDTLISRHGVMFFDDPVGAFANLNNAAQPGAQLIFSCFGERSRNNWATEVAALVADGAPANIADPTGPGPFAFADKAHVTRILAAAGWEGIAFEPVDWDYVAGDGADPVGDALAFFQQIGPAAAAIAGLEPSHRDTLLGRLADLAARHVTNGQVAFAACGWIVTAKAG
jgi:SAM-dependent methyltransferase